MDYLWRGLTASSSGYEVITFDRPFVAARMLSRSSRVADARVTEFAELMSAGLWESRASDWILVSRGEGQILDGLHRITAVVSSGTTQRFWIAFLTFPDGVREW